MRRLTLPLIILASVALAAALAWLTLSRASFGDRSPRAEAATVRTVPPFTRLDVAGTAEVTLVQGAAESVSIAASPRKQGRIDADVRDGTLHIESTDRSRWWHVFVGSAASSRPPQIVVTFKDLDSIATAGTIKLVATDVNVANLKVSGAGGTSVKIDNLVAGQLRLSGTGATRAELAGRVTDQTVTISGAGEYRGGRLVSQNATVTVAGAAQVVVNAEKTLKATISGAGSVEYFGDPQVTERISGAGRVRRRDASSGIAQVAIAE